MITAREALILTKKTLSERNRIAEQLPIRISLSKIFDQISYRSNLGYSVYYFTNFPYDADGNSFNFETGEQYAIFSRRTLDALQKVLDPLGYIVTPDKGLCSFVISWDHAQTT